MAVLRSCMSWTSATSIGTRAHPSRIVRATSGVCESGPVREHRESAGLSRSHPKGSPCPDHPAQFWCNLGSLDATLASRLVCVANKGLIQWLSPVNATLTGNGGWSLSRSSALPRITEHGLRASSCRRYPSRGRCPFRRKLNHAVS